MGQARFKQESRCAFHNDEDRDSGSKTGELQPAWALVDIVLFGS
jgi:hypothetical protein